MGSALESVKEFRGKRIVEIVGNDDVTFETAEDDRFRPVHGNEADHGMP